MLLKNTGDKIINVGRDILMPGEEKRYPESIVGKGALSALIGKGFLKVSMEKPAKAQPAQAVETAPAAEPAPAEAAPAEAAPEEKKPTRKSVKKAE